MAQNRASNNSSPFRTETALCFGARDSCGAMGIRAHPVTTLRMVLTALRACRLSEAVYVSGYKSHLANRKSVSRIIG